MTRRRLLSLEGIEQISDTVTRVAIDVMSLENGAELAVKLNDPACLDLLLRYLNTSQLIHFAMPVYEPPRLILDIVRAFEPALFSTIVLNALEML